MTRTVSANITLSLDGFAAGPGGDMSWLVDTALHEQCAGGFAGYYRGVDTVLLGRTNYEGFHGFWPAVAEDPAADARSRDFSRWFDAVEKVVFSRTLTEATWTNARVANDLEGTVTALRETDGRTVSVFSSISVMQALLAAELLDELRITRVPAVLGAGVPFWTAEVARSSWALETLQTIPTGAVVSVLRRR
ncbi:riboflavin biosynthesis protein RibD [Actinomycetospora sp. NBRC 106375]|uniref:dihydrofolate reductase family protein n=1 Tax=Actinomycetospora sp. NBRC 106375 TaxID=3032207 RepID=UPI0024A47802|nr:dihydrofolate reductase family protein [Actinomycetospora sp. NBRC 106375]GLZ49929.1 riboflavin biosynthesis protein RibD [Actinomycetospora sp. NBRC 106375]